MRFHDAGAMQCCRLVASTLFLVVVIDSEWTAWTSWTACSRTCDGGVTYRRRTCVGDTSCIGENVRYERCNAEPCTGNTDDFRNAQCTHYNTVPYNDKLYNWTARYEPHDACALWCEVIGTDLGLYAKLNFKVTDGTRCDKTTRDMCVEGTCWRVGCDDKLGSPLVLDECGVCGGDGSTCRVVNISLPATKTTYVWTETDFSQCSVSCGTGEQRTSLTCRARQSRQPVPHSYCSGLPKPALQVRMCYRQNCSFSWMADEWGVCSKPCGNGTRRRYVYCTELWTDGSYRSVSDVICTSSTSPTRLETCNNVKCPILYDASSENGTQWGSEDLNMTSLSPESADLDNLTAVVSLGAFDSDDGSSIDTRPTKLVPQAAVAPFPVYDSGKPAEGSGEGEIVSSVDVDGSAPYRNDRIANEAISTKPRFVPSEWGPCSVTCGPGVRRRQVQCKVFSQKYGAVITQPSASCTDPRPRHTTTCNVGVCRAARPTPDAFTWRFSGYGSCSASCAGGARHPLFTCVNVRDYRPVLHEYCETVPKPALPTRKCNSGPCPPRWHTFEYGSCSVSCGGGVRIRPVQCVQGMLGSDQFAILPDAICPPPAPSNRKPCNMFDCLPEWAPDEWSQCSVTCGDGVRTRNLRCKQLLHKTKIRVERPLSACNRSTTPRTRETCSLEQCPTVAPRRPTRHIVVDRSTYVQLKPQKKVQVLVGGRGVFFAGTVVSVRCSVKRFARRNVRWRHKGRYIRTKGRIKARNGVLHIRRSREKDAGLYTCVAGNLTSDIDIEFHSYEEANEKFRQRVEFVAKNTQFSQKLAQRRVRHRIKPWKVFTLPYLLDKVGLASIPFSYFAGDWSACSKTCGGAGLMYRDIQCELVHHKYYLMVDDEYCQEKGLTPPIESRDCGYQECPHWEVGPWSQCTSKICLRSGVGAITRSLYCVSYGQLFPYNMCNASETPPNQKECPREDCYATWSATSWSECSRTCGGKGVQTRALQCVWITNKQPAGINCRRLHRPSVSRTCTSPPCSQTVCQDESNYCSLIPMLRLCHLRQYRTECCLSCKFTLLDSMHLKLAKKHSQR